MAKLSIKAGSTSQTVNVFIQDSSSSTGAGLTGLVFNTGSLTAYYALPKAASVQITLATLAAVTTAYSSGGFKEIDATNMAGWYRLDLPDAALASSNRFVSVHLKGAANMAPCPLEIELTVQDNQVDVLSTTVENSTSVVQFIRGFASVLLGKASGLGTTTAVYRDTADSKDRVTATVDADGNRSAITRDMT